MPRPNHRSKNRADSREKDVAKRRPAQPQAHNLAPLTPQANPVAALQRTTVAPASGLKAEDIPALQQAVGNQAVQRLLVQRNPDRPADRTTSHSAPSQTGPTLAPVENTSEAADQIVKWNARTEPQSVKRVVQRSKLSDYKDAKKPEHDPAKLPDWEIQATDEFKELEAKFGLTPLIDHYSTDEILLACRLIIRSLREGKSFDLDKDAQKFLTQARRQLGTLEGVTSLGGDFKGKDSVTWVQQGMGLQKTEFGKWLLAGGKEPDPKSGTMNCWEVVLFGAYRAGFVNKNWLETFYKKFAANLSKAANPMTDKTYETELRSSSEYIFDPLSPDSPEPLPGDIVIFDTAVSHTAISLGVKNVTGEHEVLSLWNTPNNHRYLQRTTIEALLGAGASGPVKFWSPKWQ